MAFSTPQIAILGAGPGGLTLARLLEVKRIDYVVYERDDSANAFDNQGGSLDIHHDDGQLALKEAGLFDKFKSLARYDGQAFKAVDKDLNVIWDMPYTGQEGRPEIDRKELRRMLAESIPPQKIRWNAKVQSLEREIDGCIVVKFSDGSVAKGFKLVVGADGAWSKARSLVTSERPEYSGICYFRATISPANPIYHRVCKQVGTGMYLAVTGGKQVVAMRMGDASYVVYAGVPRPEHWSKDNANFFQSSRFREHLVAHDFAGWNSEITDLLTYSDDEQWHCWPLYSLPMTFKGWKSVSGITLIGDAAHLSFTNGEGVNHALFDGFQLANAIEKFGLDSLDDAIEAYEKKMIPRGLESLKEGEEAKRRFFGEDSPQQLKAWVASMPTEGV